MRMQLLTRRADVARGAGDMSDASALAMLMRETKPDEVYNLAAQSHVAVSFVMPKCVSAPGLRRLRAPGGRRRVLIGAEAASFGARRYTAEVDGLGTLNLLESIRLAGLEKTTRFYQASTSEMFGLVQEVPQRETTPFYPRSPCVPAPSLRCCVLALLCSIAVASG